MKTLPFLARLRLLRRCALLSADSFASHRHRRCISTGSLPPFAPRTSAFVTQHNQNNDQKDRVDAPQALVATRRLMPNDLIYTWTAPLTTGRDHWSLQAGENQHMELRCHVLRFINHSCKPNVAMTDSLQFYALCSIVEGEELTIDYNAFEDELGFGTFHCVCGAKDCVGEVKGWRHLTAAQRAARHDRALTWLLERWPPTS